MWRKECDQIKALNENLFRVITVFFSSILLILSLLANVTISAEKRHTAELESNIEKLMEENLELEIEICRRLSLEELEKRALALGMISSEPGQTVYIDD